MGPRRCCIADERVIHLEVIPKCVVYLQHNFDVFIVFES
jgi:hypothetical protein